MEVGQAVRKYQHMSPGRQTLEDTAEVEHMRDVISMGRDIPVLEKSSIITLTASLSPSQSSHRWEYDGRVSGAPAVMEVHTMHPGLHQGQGVVDVEQGSGQRVARPGQTLDRQRVGLLNTELQPLLLGPTHPGTYGPQGQVHLHRTGIINQGMAGI